MTDEKYFQVYLINFQVIYTSGKPVFNSKHETTLNNLGKKKFKKGSRETVSRMYSTVVAVDEQHLAPATINTEIAKIIKNLEAGNYENKKDKSSYSGFDNEIILALPISVSNLGYMTTEEANTTQIIYNDSANYASSEKEREEKSKEVEEIKEPIEITNE